MTLTPHPGSAGAPQIVPEPRQVGIGVIWRLGSNGNAPVQVLCSKRKLGDTLGGYWEFPGGRIEQGETVLQCVVRELQEETGITMSAAHGVWSEVVVFEPASGSGAPRFHMIHAPAPLGAAPMPLESEECRWVGLHDLAALKFPPANQVMVRHIEVTLARSGV